jgi:hypothetical protein
MMGEPMAPTIHRAILRSLGPTGVGPEEVEWLFDTPGEGMRQTRETRWVGYLQAEYTTEPEDDQGTSMVVVLVRPDGSEHVFRAGGYVLYNGIYRLIHATGTDWNVVTGSSVTIILSAANSSLVVNDQTVFQVPGHHNYIMFYSRGAIGGSGSREIGIGYSDDLATWDFSDLTDIMVPTSGWESLRAHTPALLKVSVSPYLEPVIDGSGRWKLYYAGQSGSVADTGLAYMEPE